MELLASQADPTLWGVGKRPITASRGTGGRLFNITPGKPGESIMLYRMLSTDPGVMMPELPRRPVDEEGVALIREWIAAMKTPAR